MIGTSSNMYIVLCIAHVVYKLYFRLVSSGDFSGSNIPISIGPVQVEPIVSIRTGREISQIVWIASSVHSDYDMIAVCYSFASEIHLYNLESDSPASVVYTLVPRYQEGDKGNRSMTAIPPSATNLSRSNGQSSCQVIAGSCVGVIRMWSCSKANMKCGSVTIKPVWEAIADSHSPLGSHSAVVGLKYLSENGRHLVSVTTNGVVCFWDMEDIRNSSFGKAPSPVCLKRMDIWATSMISRCSNCKIIGITGHNNSTRITCTTSTGDFIVYDFEGESNLVEYAAINSAMGHRTVKMISEGDFQGISSPRCMGITSPCQNQVSCMVEVSIPLISLLCDCRKFIMLTQQTLQFYVVLLWRQKSIPMIFSRPHLDEWQVDILTLSLDMCAMQSSATLLYLQLSISRSIYVALQWHQLPLINHVV